MSQANLHHTLKKQIAPVFLCALLAACGGGSADGGTSTPLSGQRTGSLTAPASGNIGETSSWSVTDLTASIGAKSQTAAINDRGDIVGFTKTTEGGRGTPPVQNPFLYSQGRYTDLGSLGGTYGGANAINVYGQIVGYSYVPSLSQSHAFVYSEGTMRDLGTLDGTGGSWAQGINDAGHIVGVSRGQDGRDRAFIYRNGVMQDLGSLGGSTTSAVAINNAGQVAGWGYDANFEQRAFLYDDGLMINLGKLAGMTSSYAKGINNSGQVVGISYIIGEGTTRSFVYSGGRMTDIGDLGGGTTFANAINDSGEIVGSSNDKDNQQRAFLYSGGQMIDLNSLPGVAASGWTMRSALSINNSGEIIANGTLKDEQRVFLLKRTAM